MSLTLPAFVALVTVIGFCVVARRFDLRERERETDELLSGKAKPGSHHSEPDGRQGYQARYEAVYDSLTQPLWRKLYACTALEKTSIEPFEHVESRDRHEIGSGRNTRASTMCPA